MRGRPAHLLYSLPALALAIPTLPAHVLVPTYYAQSLGLGLAATGTAIFVARVIDVLADPIAGLASDRAGRRKPFIAGGAVIAAIALYAVFSPPADPGPLYLGFWYALLYIGWSLVMVAYTAWGAELSTDYAERSQITSWREGAGLIGISIAATLPALLQQLDWQQGAAMQATALMAICLGVPTLFLALHFVPEGRRRPQIVGQWQLAVADNPPFRRLLAAWFINGVANGLPAGLFPLFVTLRLGADAQQTGLVLLIYFAAALASLPCWLWLLRRIDKHRLWSVAMAVAILAFLVVPLLPHGAVIAFACICVVTGFALGADLALPPAIQADVVDFDRWRHGTERAGLYFALSNMSAKLSGAIALGLAFPLLAFLGLDINAAASAAGDTLALAVIYAWVPCVFKAIAAAMMWSFPLDRKTQASIAQEIRN